MIEAAKIKLKNYDDMEYLVQDFYSFDFFEKYDVIISSLVIHYLITDEDKRSFYRKIYNNLSTQVKIGTDEGLKQESAIHCDELISIPKNKLKHFISILPLNKVDKLDLALKISLDLKLL